MIPPAPFSVSLILLPLFRGFLSIFSSGLFRQRPTPMSHYNPYGSAQPSRSPYDYRYTPAPTPPPPPPGSYRPYDPYPTESRRYPYDNPPPPQQQQRGPYDDHYDPYQPSASAYQAPPPQPIRVPLNYSLNVPLPPQPQSVAPRQPVRHSPPRNAPYPPRPISHPPASTPPPQSSTELTILTPPTTVSVAGHTTAVYTLPPSHLPITKYVAVNRDDAVELHHRLSSAHPTVWYTAACTRAGEAWSTATEWNTKENQSGKKMRGVIQGGEAMDGELAGICKAVEGFQELLHQSIRNGTPITSELVIFCDSQAAIVAIDTSSHPEALRFDHLWREICTEFLYAHITLVWIPRDSNVEGYVLTHKIAVVAAGNSYTKRRKERALPEQYVRMGTGDAERPASVVAGPWQRGDADPSRRKAVFERPRPRPEPEPVTRTTPAAVPAPVPTPAPAPMSLPLPSSLPSISVPPIPAFSLASPLPASLTSITHPPMPSAAPPASVDNGLSVQAPETAVGGHVETFADAPGPDFDFDDEITPRPNSIFVTKCVLIRLHT